MIEAANRLSEAYGRRGGIYTIPNFIWDALTKFFGFEQSKSKTQKDLSTVVAELEKLKENKEQLDDGANEYDAKIRRSSS